MSNDAIDDLNEQEQIRREKLARIQSQGIDPFPVGFKPDHTLLEVRNENKDLAPEAKTGKIVSIAGRVMLNRIAGKLIFATLRDGSGDLQVMIAADAVGEESIEMWKENVDLGDHVGLTGEVVTTKRGELSVKASKWLITGKSLKPLPDKHHGLNDPEQRVRMRYVDLIVRPEAREMLHVRSKVVSSIRKSLTDRGFVEVETPMLQVLHGGANARPFKTHINAYDMELFLRIAPELYLKRLLVGGVDKVFEINRNFRNEGADSSHNPEFTMLEMYQAYGDYDVMRELTQQLIQEAAKNVYGKEIVRHWDDEGNHTEHDISGQWPVVKVYDGLSKATGEKINADTDEKTLRNLCDKLKISHDPKWTRGQVVLELYEHLLEDKTVLPTFYTDFPTDVAPLTRQHREDNRVAERWDLVAFGAEIGTAYTELNDPIEQRKRLTEQAQLAAGGDVEAMQIDEDFLRALEYGMPPAGGQGMGIDRVLMMLTGRGIRETVLFPLVKPQ
jgi:lysyl-tRNA synthetase, class II